VEAAEAAAQLFGGNLGTLLGRLADAVSEAAGKAGSHEQATKGERKIEIGGREGRLVFGYSVRVGLDGAEGAPFGHVAPGQAAPSPDAARQPIVDVIEEDDAIVVVAEMPGASEGDVTVTVDAANTLSIATPPPTRYGHSIALPCPVDEAGMTCACRNGILEVRLPRRTGGPA
jgi:HSP20 family protein